MDNCQQNYHRFFTWFKTRVILIFLLTVYGTVTCGSLFAQGFKCDFVQDENYYSISAKIILNKNAECILNEIFLFDNIIEYSPEVKSLSQTNVSDTSYYLTYAYSKYLIFKNKSVWKRQIFPEKKMISFELIEEENNTELIPEIISSNGYYQITDDGGNVVLIYFQECSLSDNSLNERYIKIAREEAYHFLELFEKFLDRKCQNT